ncbi:MAG: PilZ domain-containing protein [Acidobacteriia bacterium]|nr:PilZ domain-containing protein [Terriglobia bacterium]
MNEHAQRRAGRLPAKLAIVLILDSAGEKTEVQAQSSDLSQYGAGLYAEADLQAGQLVEVVPSEGLKYAVRARVIWVGSPEAEKGRRAGLEFLVALPTAV